MKIAVVGAGAMGSLFGALLAESGADVLVGGCLAGARKGNQLESGLTVESGGRKRSVPLKATTDLEAAVGAQLSSSSSNPLQTGAATASAARLVGNTGSVLTLQNGMGNAETLAAAINHDQIVVGTTSHGATLLGPGCIRHAGTGPTIIGSWDRRFQRASTG